jgi:DNA-binding IclR family transcriptional regulator
LPIQSGIKSVEVGGRLLQALARGHTPVTLKELAAEAGLTPSSAHHYLVSYRRLGLVVQDPNTLSYDIGPFAVELGLSAIGRSRQLTAAQELQQKVRDRLDESVMLAIWGSYGPVIISVEESSKPVVMTMRVGATLPLLRTATGWIFAAFMPRTIIRPVMRAEYEAGRPPVERLDRRALDLKLDAIRAAQLVGHSGHLLPGVAAVAAPLLDSRDRIVAVMSVFGSSELFDSSLAGAPAGALKDMAHTFSKATRHSHAA